MRQENFGDLDRQQITNLIWNEYKDQNDWMRHNESQRATLSTILLGISSGLLTFYPQTGGGWAIPILLIVIGLLGSLAILKYWERFKFHNQKAIAFSHLLDTYYPGGNSINSSGGEHLLTQTHQLGESKHLAKWSKGWKLFLTDGRIMQHWLWIVVFLCIAFSGSVLLLEVILDKFQEGSLLICDAC